METSTNTEKNAKRRKAMKIGGIAVAAAVLVMIISSVVILARRSDDTILSGVRIEKVSVGGLTREQAVEKVREKVTFEDNDTTLQVVTDGQTDTVKVNELIDGYDYEKAAEAAFQIGRGGNKVTNALKAIGVAIGKENIALEYKTDEVMIAQFVDTLQAKIESPVVQNQYSIEKNKLKFVNGTKGFAVDKQKLLDDIIAALKAKTDESTVQTAMVEVIPDAYDVEKIYAEIHREAKNAGIETVDGVVRIEKAQTGYDFDKTALTRLLEENRDNTEPYYLDLTVVEPKIKSVDESSLFRDTLSSFTSRIKDSDANRLNNVRRAAQSINGVVLNPGEVFSYNNTLGPVTAANGYKSANVYSAGKIEKGIGGGVCQVSSALYSALLQADMEILTRYNHSLIVSYVPYGQDATVSSGSIDLRFRNNTNAPMKIVASMDNSGVYVTLRGINAHPNRKITIENVTVETIPVQTTVKEDAGLAAGQVKVEQKGMTGYVVDTYKNIYENGSFVKREYVSRSRYKMLERIEVHGTAPVQAEPAQAAPITPAEEAVQPTEAPVQTPQVQPEETTPPEETGDAETTETENTVA